jgi:hypothetical protein
MHRHIGRRNFLGSLGLLFASPRLRAQRTLPNDPQPDASIAEAARGFLAALRPERLERRLVRYTRKGVWGINGFYPARSFL